MRESQADSLGERDYKADLSGTESEIDQPSGRISRLAVTDAGTPSEG
jgi:hypothetical protein